MIMFGQNRTYENEYCMFYFDQIYGTCYQVIMIEDKYYFIKIGNGLFTIKEKNICKDADELEVRIKRKKVKIVLKSEIQIIQIIEGKQAFDIATYDYDRLVLFNSATFTKRLQSVFNVSAVQILNFFFR